MRTAWVGVVAFVVTVAAGCSQKARDEGSAQISVHALSLANDVKAVEIFVTGAGIPVPIDMPLYLQGDGLWNGLVGHIPVGSGNRTFTAKAYDSVDKANQIYSGSVLGVTISKNQVADVTIVLQEQTPSATFANHAPVIDSLTVSSISVGYGDKVAYTVAAHDPDTGETAGLTFSPGLPSGCGSFGTATDVMVGSNRQWSNLWTAPVTDQTCLLTMTVADVHSAKAMASVTITVSTGPDNGGARVSTLFESYPVITNLTSTPTAPAIVLLPGGGTTLMVVASQPEHEPLTFAWSSDCAGGFDDTSAQSPVFTLAAGSTAATCTFTVVVSGPIKVDSKGQSRSLSTTGSLTVGVGSPPPAPPVGGPVIDLASQSAFGVVEAGSVVTFFVRAHDDNGSAVLSGYSWNASDGILAYPTNAADLSYSQVDWTAPAARTGTVSVIVTVTDSQGATTSFAFLFCTCTGPGIGGVPVTVSCGDSACGQDLQTWTCSDSGWSPTGLSCGGSLDAGPDTNVCECSGQVFGDGIETFSCGQSACDPQNMRWTCGASGWTATGVSCAGLDAGPDTSVCECSGPGYAGGTVTVLCGQLACDPQNMSWTCSASGWTATGQSCARCECTGPGIGGANVTVPCGQNACEADGHTWVCDATLGWTGPGATCP